MQLDAAIGVGVRHGQELLTDSRADGQLFPQLAREARRVGLASFTFAAGEFPESCQRHAARPSCDEEPSRALDDRGGDDDGCQRSAPLRRNVQSFSIGQTRHFGFRATQTMAPKSINA